MTQVSTSSTRTGNALAADLDHVLAHTTELWPPLKGQRLFLTGGSGFVGSWLLESLLWANDRLGLDVEVVVLARQAPVFRQTLPHVAGHRAVRILEGDVRSFAFPDDPCRVVIHAASEMDRTDVPGGGRRMIEIIVDGTRRVMDFARHAGATRALVVSSGAVYGPQPASLARVAEDYAGAPSCLEPASSYGESKRLAELSAILAGRDHGFEVAIARGFAFIGPYLPTNGLYAIGNFVRDALRGGPVRVTGDGTPRRSYLYAADLAVWLWTIALKGHSGTAYNVGSSHDVSIGEAAQLVARVAGVAAIIDRQADPSVPCQRYVPDTGNAQRQLGLQAWIGIEDAVRRTLDWHRGLGQTGLSLHESIRPHR